MIKTKTESKTTDIHACDFCGKEETGYLYYNIIACHFCEKDTCPDCRTQIVVDSGVGDSDAWRIYTCKPCDLKFGDLVKKFVSERHDMINRHATELDDLEVTFDKMAKELKKAMQ